MITYVLNDDGEPVAEPDMHAWGAWMQTADRKVGLDIVNGLRVSTVFLGLDHRFGDGPPLIYETMVFPETGPMAEKAAERYTTRDEALAGHAAMLKRATEAPETFDA